jgi:hypothetical protein
VNQLFDDSEFTVGKNAYALVVPLRRLSRTEDPPTSKAAAKAAHPVSGTLRSYVLAALKAAGPDGLTHEEIVRAVHAGHPTYSESGVRTRTRELVDAGLVFDSERTRRTARGLASTVWSTVAPHHGAAPAPDPAQENLPSRIGGTNPEDVA